METVLACPDKAAAVYSNPLDASRRGKKGLGVFSR